MPLFQPIVSSIVTKRATGNLPQTTHTPIFTISGGRVRIISLFGEVTTVCQAAANLLKLSAYPTTGASEDICTTLDINAFAVGRMVGITGTTTDALLASVGGGVKSDMQIALIVRAGTIDADCSASRTGQIQWSCEWIPFDEGASLA